MQLTVRSAVQLTDGADGSSSGFPVLMPERVRQRTGRGQELREGVSLFLRRIEVSSNSR